MIVGSNVNTLLQQVMALRTPALTELLPEIEKLEYSARAAMVQRGHDNLSAVIKNWDKFSEILAAQRGLSKSEIKAKAKSLKNVRSKLEMALRLADPKKIPAPFRSKAEAAFNVVAAWFLLHQDYMESVYGGPRLSRQDVADLVLPPAEQLETPSAPNVPAAIEIRDEVFEGPAISNLGVNSLASGNLVNLMDATGQSAVH